MWFSLGSSPLFPPPSKDWLQNALSDPKGLGWGGEGQPAGKVLKICPAEEEEKEEESALLSLLERGKLEETLGLDLEAGVSTHVPQDVEWQLEDIRIKLQKIEEAHERQELKVMEDTEERQPQEEESKVTAGASSLSSSLAPCDNEAIHLWRPENGMPFQGTSTVNLKADHRSVYVGNVDYCGTAEELETHFNSCGEINRVTILCDKYSGHPKGYAYIEFAYEDSVKTAMTLDESTFRGRIIKVLPKRTNFPGISTTDRGGFRARLSGRGAPPHRYGLYNGERSRPRWRSHRGHGRFSQWFEPY